jgi:hypothetical protein
VVIDAIQHESSLATKMATMVSGDPHRSRQRDEKVLTRGGAGMTEQLTVAVLCELAEIELCRARLARIRVVLLFDRHGTKLAPKGSDIAL